MSTLVSITYEGIRYDNVRLLVNADAVEIVPPSPTHERTVSPNTSASASEFRRAAREAYEMARREISAARGWQRQVRLGVPCSDQVQRRVRRAAWWRRHARWLAAMAASQVTKLSPLFPSQEV